MRYITYIVCVALLALTACSPKNALMTTTDKDGSKMLVGTSSRGALDDPAFS